MRELPDCLARRYKMLDSLAQDISTVVPASLGDKSPSGCSYADSAATEDESENREVGIKLMCDFWKILDDDPECNLRQEVQLRMCKDSCSAECSLAGKTTPTKRSRSSSSCKKMKKSRAPSSDMQKKGGSKYHSRCSHVAKAGEDESLRKVLGDIRTAASFEQKCTNKIGELESLHKNLIQQVNNLEVKVKKGSGLLKEADCMWACMEGSYKMKFNDAKEHCQLVQGQLNEIEASLKKWRKIQQDLEDQLKSLNKYSEDSNVKIIQKENDLKVMRMEIDGYKKRIESDKKDLTAAKKSYASKKEASDGRLKKLAKETEAFQKQHREECKRIADKEKEGNASIKEVREDLQKLCRCLLQKKIENEDLKAETDALLNEVDLLHKTCDTCKDRCSRRQQNILEESRRLDKELSQFQLRCSHCHKQTSSADVTGFCFECPRCLDTRECLTEGDHCSPDPTHDCVCTRIKRKFLDNVFENMYTLLESQAKTCPGKELADCILNGLQRSRNGKLNLESRSILQDFILSTVKQNLNLTIVGGAVKTRCEMDPETYRQLMLCLKDVTVTKPEREDKGTIPRKLPCSRWKHSNECYCPKGPKTCPCTKTAPKKPTSPSSCGPVEEEVKEDQGVKFCPQPEPVACSLDCGMLGLPGAQSWKRPPCKGSTCTFSSNMRAAQCVLGPEALADVRAHTAEGRSCTVDKTDDLERPDTKDPESQRLNRPVNSAETRGYKDERRRYKDESCACNAEPRAYKAESRRLRDETRAHSASGRTHKSDGRAHTSRGRTPKTDVRTPSSSTSVTPKKATGISGGTAVNSFRTETKHPKVNFKYNKGRRANFHKKTKAIRKDAVSAKTNLKPLSSLQNAILFCDQHQERIFEVVTKNKVKQDEAKELFKNVKIQSNCEFTELIQTQTETLAINLDNHSVTIMEERNITDLYLCKTIKKTDSRHVSVYIDAKKEQENKDHPKVTITKIPSENRLDINKNMIRKLKDSSANKIPNEGLSENIALLTSPPNPIKVNSDDDENENKSKGPQPQDFNVLNFHIMNNKEGEFKCTHLKTTTAGAILMETHTPLSHKQNNDLNAKCSSTPVNDANLMLKDINGNTITYKRVLLKKKKTGKPTCSSDELNKSSVRISTPSRSEDNFTYITELKELYEEGNADIVIKIQGENEEIQRLPAIVRKTKSGNIAIYAKENIFLKDVHFGGKVCPVVFAKEASRTYFLSRDEKEQSFNATLIKTPSEGMLLIPISFEEQRPNECELEHLFEVNLCVMQNQLIELSAVLRPTTSNNYIVVLDKEFEKCYTQNVKEYFGDNFKGSVDLQLTSSGNYLLELYNKDESHLEHKKRNAWLVKTSSENIKVIVRPEFQSIFQPQLSITSTSSTQISAQVNNNLPTPSRDLLKVNKKTSKRLENEVNAGKLKLKLLDDLPLPFLKHILNKESNKSLLNNVQSDSLTCNSDKPVFTKQLDASEIVIKLNNRDNSKTHYGTLKITPSGNFYVAVDEEVVKDLTNSSAKNDTFSSTIGERSKHASQLIDSVHKSVATACQSISGVCNSDPSACSCAGVKFESIDGSMQNLCPCIREEANDISDTVKNDSVPIPSTSWNETGALDIDPSFESFDSQPGTHYNGLKSTKQCYYFFHQLCNDKFCYEHVIRPKEVIEFVAKVEQPCQVWDSLNYLPQQLPYFLREACYR